MEQVLNWRKGLFDSNYQVFSDFTLKFSLNFISLKNSAVATTQSGIYFFTSEGYSSPETKITNSKNETLAIIKYDWLKFKASIFFPAGEPIDWTFQNSWLSRWSLNNHNDKQIIYNSSTNSGLIHTNVDDDILPAAGLFIREYYNRLIYALILFVLLMSVFRNVF